MALTFYNTLDRKKIPFNPLKDNKVGIYTCGPTVYQFAHLGNLRAYVFADLLNRTLRAKGWTVKHLINITDVGHLASDQDEGEDKIEASARKEGKSPQTVATFYTEAFWDDLKLLGFDLSNYEFPRATDHLPEMIDQIKQLEQNGFTYQTSDGLYFDTTKYPAYAELAELNLNGQQNSARIELNPEKRNPSDFALWKFVAPDDKREQVWPSPWGQGFPGWHIECSAMALKYLGPNFDIHTGGIDHIPVHHTNERAQAFGIGDKDYVRFWLHVNFMMVESKKMSKSLANVYLLKDLIQRDFSPLAFRYLLLGVHYRAELNFTWDALAGAEIAWHKLIQNAKDLANQDSGTGQIDQNYYERFLSVLDNDLNSAQALAIVWELIKDEKINPANRLTTLLKIDQILGLDLKSHLALDNIPEDITLLVARREKARQTNDWTEADKLRQELADLGYEVLDTPTGPKVRLRVKFNS
ncbi:MAG: cysteine--tRNA ligase [Candidatus Vogelbacteria bacterium CG22_combo_CG10-13_8_21_14_all_37_9]|uniref:Cysteine--tRNA ligase n=1 Tax=Candidatus Vogelbacteria bacterium CG22_combo_CG10-13_8_21_14_all_37_9 TaxID=1975046 RepID=A0A2H0BKV2_9BACT|nr:MAG: cysteine--tRNA ligase [bacterium CG10_37_50]PIP58307.1 MAG: cysteine--tRNA ligase [Candidatus Vogelbacteria bacterium CG22_combo_CG10-13_8_21_14_all_37_9]